MFDTLYDVDVIILQVRLRREAGLSASMYSAEPMIMMTSLHLSRYPFRRCLSVFLIDVSSASVAKW